MEKQDKKAKQERRTRYATPRLVEYGSVAKLTRGGSGPGAEGESGMSGMN